MFSEVTPHPAGRSSTPSAGLHRCPERGHPSWRGEPLLGTNGAPEAELAVSYTHLRGPRDSTSS
eukprot:1610063-Prorocentrum_lima.AAC.1